MMSDICKVSDGMSAVEKCLRIFLIPCFGSDCVWEWRNTSLPETVRKKYTTFSTVQIVALRSVIKFSLRATISQLSVLVFIRQLFFIRRLFHSFHNFFDLSITEET
jgi:hypothetical protein